jgi:hypothetical protein
MLDRQHHQNHAADRGSRRRLRRAARGPDRHHHHSVRLTEEGFPAAAPDAPKPSPVVAVSEESRALYPWLPGRVIAGSVWRGPQQQRVRVDERGEAVPYRSGPSPLR